MVEQFRYPKQPQRDSYRLTEDKDAPAVIRAITDACTIDGYRRVTAVLNRARPIASASQISHMRASWLIRLSSRLLPPRTGRSSIRAHEGSVVAAASNERWASNGLEIHCHSSEVVPIAFAIDTHHREIITPIAIYAGGILGEMIRDIMLDCVERRFNALRVPFPVQWLAENGSAYTATKTTDFAAALNLFPCCTPVRSPGSDGVCETVTKNLKRDYARVNRRSGDISILQQLPAWFEDYNNIHLHSSLRMRLPCEFIVRQ
jgi:putative transposase